MTQNEQVLAWLKQGKTLTPLDALDHFGCFRLSARIYELKELGWPIECDPYFFRAQPCLRHMGGRYRHQDG